MILDGSILKTAEASALEIGFVGSTQPIASGFAPGWVVLYIYISKSVQKITLALKPIEHWE